MTKVAIGRKQPDADMGTIEATATHPWCVVLSPGEADEYVEGIQHRHHAQAAEWVRQAREAGNSADVMRRLPDGSLTTEF